MPTDIRLSCAVTAPTENQIGRFYFLDVAEFALKHFASHATREVKREGYKYTDLGDNVTAVHLETSIS